MGVELAGPPVTNREVAWAVVLVLVVLAVGALTARPADNGTDVPPTTTAQEAP